jgi:hypothetical protein
MISSANVVWLPWRILSVSIQDPITGSAARSTGAGSGMWHE